MALWALTLCVLYLALAVGGRMLVQLRRTGSTGFGGTVERSGSAEWIGGVLRAAALCLALASPVLDLAGVLEPIYLLDGLVGHALGFVLFFVGLVGPLFAQGAMGASWCIGVDEAERTKLVMTGPFALIRNPIFTAAIATFLGLALLVPNIAALAAFVALVAGLELQVRFVEEPYLIRAHGERYLAYASRPGRFVPGFGRLKA